VDSPESFGYILVCGVAVGIDDKGIKMPSENIVL
jgi:hypothetical protein